MSDWDRTADNASQFLPSSQLAEPVDPRPAPLPEFPEELRLGRFIARQVEADAGLSFHQARIDRALLLHRLASAAAAPPRRELPVQDFGRAYSRPNDPLPARLLAPALIALDVTGVVTAVILWPRLLAVLALLAGALVGLALAARLEP